MRDLIDIITSASHDSVGDARDLDAARTILTNMSMLARYRLIDKLPYIALDKGGWAARYKQAVEYIATHMDEFTQPEPTDTRDLADGGIHRIM